MFKLTKLLFAWLLIFALPFQAYATASMQNCAANHYNPAHLTQSVQSGHNLTAVTNNVNEHQQHLQTAFKPSTDSQPTHPTKSFPDKCSACSVCCASCGLVNSMSPCIATFTSSVLIQFQQKSFSNHTPAGLDPPPKHLLA